MLRSQTVADLKKIQPRRMFTFYLFFYLGREGSVVLPCAWLIGWFASVWFGRKQTHT